MAIRSNLISLFTLLLLISTQAHAGRPITCRSSRARAFIELQCRTTLYHDLCIRTLSNYMSNFSTSLSHQRLVQIALKVSLDRAESTQSYVKELSKGMTIKATSTNNYDYQTLQDCIAQINDGVEQLKNSIKEAQFIKENGRTSNFPWHASNMKTWMSTALTDASLCIDGFSGRAVGGKNKALIKAKVLNLEQVTSIALALFNGFAKRYMASHAVKP